MAAKTRNNLSYKLHSLLHKLRPELYWRPYAVNAPLLGFDRLYMVLSFDCDTDEDIPAAQKIHDWLKARGRKAVFAVPGAQLRMGAKTFRKMAEEGAEFINHGAAPHAEWREGRYWSRTFYDQMSPEEVEQDIRQGHEILEQVVERQPKGFRAPHFGHYQSPEQLQHLYMILLDMGYTYASTTLPATHRPPAPVHFFNGIFEFPVTGRYNAPLQIFDSYGHLHSFHHPTVTDQYGQRFIASVRELQKHQVPGLLNYYTDPAHVADSSTFFQALEYCFDQDIQAVTFMDLLETINKKVH